MRVKVAIAIVCLLAFTLTTAYAVEIKVNNSNFAALGWKTTLKTGKAGYPGSISFQLRSETTPPWVEGLLCYSNKSTSASVGWSGLSKTFTPGTRLDTITTLSTFTCATQGAGNEPACIYLGVVVGGVSHNIRALPHTTLGRPVNWTMAQYDLLGSMKWRDETDGLIYTWTGFLTAYPTAQLATEAESTGLPSGQNFNCFVGGATSGELALAQDGRGLMDWVDIGFGTEEVVRYNFDAPEPSSILALFTGVVGLLALRRRR